MSLPLILHVLYRFDTGGLENGVVNLINRMAGYEHAVLALDRCVPTFCERVTRPGVRFISLHKPPGQGLKLAPAMARQLRELRPAIVHTRNLAALEMQLPTWWASRAARVHGEHGWDVDDLGGRSQRHRLMRLAFRPFVQRYIALSGDLAQYLQDRIKVPADRITRICNGVDTDRFAPASAGREPPEGSPFADPNLFVVGTVGRMQPVKAQTLLVDAFIAALQTAPQLRDRLRLVLAGDGPMRADCAVRLAAAGVHELAWLAGERRDVPQIMRGLDGFVLPSLAEGISNTILEAMASGLPVLATRVGGNAELVAEGQTGLLVESGSVERLRDGLLRLASDPTAAAAMGRAGRRRAEQQFSITGMVDAYANVYDELLKASR